MLAFGGIISEGNLYRKIDSPPLHVRVRCAADSLHLSRRPRRLLHVSGGRWLGDRQPYRAVDLDGAVSVSDRADLARRLLRLQGTRRSGRKPSASSLPPAG